LQKNLLDNKFLRPVGSSYYAEVVLPLALPTVLTYQVPEHLINECLPGVRVVVPLGAKKKYSGVVFSVHQRKPDDFLPKMVELVLDKRAVVVEPQFKFWQWIAQYYLCTIGEVLAAALPSALKLDSETLFALNPNFSGDVSELGEHELEILDLLSLKPILKLTELQDLLKKKSVAKEIKALLECGAIKISENLSDKFKPKQKVFLSLAEEYLNSEEKFNQLFTELESKAKKQLEALLKFLDLSRVFTGNAREVEKIQLQRAGAYSDAVVKALIDKGILIAYDKVVGRLDGFSGEVGGVPPLSEAQLEALQKVKQGFEKNIPVLLKGVTGSGKTEIYASLIKEEIDKGKQVLFMVPEIALTTQLVLRIGAYFGDKAGVYHSGFSDQQRVEIWFKVSEHNGEQCAVMLGTRSSLHLPFKNLGLIIIDEEHEPSYKQSDPAPRYHARDAAIVLANMHKAKVLLGSATPSIESYYNALKGKYFLVNLNTRYGNAVLPEVNLINLKKAHAKKEISGHFSNELLQEIKQRLDKKEQVILFQNRRGYAPKLTCKVCGYLAECKSCDISLTYHKFLNHLVCHYCGYKEGVPQNCPSCGSMAFDLKGVGTEQIEEELKNFFPKARVHRLDTDSTRGKGKLGTILEKFELGEIDILVGTQMITKGLDFDFVTLVGVINADSLFSVANFRANERGFQLLSQLAGRAGRKEKIGNVFIQAYKPEREVYKSVIEHNYVEMYQTEIADRETFYYPPFSRVTLITLKHIKPEVVRNAATQLADKLKVALPQHVVGPSIPEVSRVKNYFLQQIMLKLPNSVRQHEMKSLAKNMCEQLKASRGFASVRITIDVDYF
jgi:primosomal protein N' (replication factor Y)